MITGRGATRFSPDGGWAACRATSHTGEQLLELWRLTPSGPRRISTAAGSGEASQTQLVVLDDGRALYTTYRPGEQAVHVVHQDGRSEPLGRSVLPMRFLPPPAGSGWLSIALSFMDGETVVAAVVDDGEWLRPISRVPGRVGGAGVSGAYLALTVLLNGVPTVLRFDPERAVCEPLLGPDDPLVGIPAHVLVTAGDHILLGLSIKDLSAESRASKGLNSGDQDGEAHRLAVVSTTTRGAWMVPTLSGMDGVVTPAAVDGAGRTALLTVAHGVHSRLRLLDLRTGATAQVEAQPGAFTATGAWSPHGWWLPYSGPDQPYTFAWLPPEANSVQIAEESTQDTVYIAKGSVHDTVHIVEESADGVGWVDARVESLPGADGPIETVVYGPDWRSSSVVVVALHGGPDAHWTLAFDSLFQLLAGAGLTVVAPNQRGSTGYGRAYQDAIAGAWGGPDLADIQAVARHLRSERHPHAARPALYGSSYGAFLALLAAAEDPPAWSGCAAIAPFRSATALYAEAAPPVRNLIDRLRGRGDGAAGPDADLDRTVDRITAPVFIAHGVLDETIPVAQSRELVRRLSQASQPRVSYYEMPHRGHAGFRAAAADPVAAALIAFLRDCARHDMATVDI